MFLYQYTYEAFTKSICLESDVESLQFDVTGADTSRVYIHILMYGLSGRYSEKDIKMVYKGKLKGYLKYY